LYKEIKEVDFYIEYTEKENGTLELETIPDETEIGLICGEISK